MDKKLVSTFKKPPQAVFVFCLLPAHSVRSIGNNRRVWLVFVGTRQNNRHALFFTLHKGLHSLCYLYSEDRMLRMQCFKQSPWETDISAFPGM